MPHFYAHKHKGNVLITCFPEQPDEKAFRRVIEANGFDDSPFHPIDPADLPSREKRAEWQLDKGKVVAVEKADAAEGAEK